MALSKHSFMLSGREEAKASDATPGQSEVAQVRHADQTETAKVVQPDQAAAYERRQRLYQFEEGVDAHRKSWTLAAPPLAVIHDEQLYLAMDDSWDAYMERRHKMTGRQGRAYVRAAAVAKNIAGVKHVLGLGAALRLAKLDDAAEQVDCLKAAIGREGSLSPTAECVAAVVAAFQGNKSGPKPKKKGPPKPRRVILAAVTATVLERKHVYAITIPKPKKPAGADLSTLLRQMSDQVAAPALDPAKQGS